jgi:hypothetical protein
MDLLYTCLQYYQGVSKVLKHNGNIDNTYNMCYYILVLKWGHQVAFDCRLGC